MPGKLSSKEGLSLYTIGVRAEGRTRRKYVVLLLSHFLEATWRGASSVTSSNLDAGASSTTSSNRAAIYASLLLYEFTLLDRVHFPGLVIPELLAVFAFEVPRAFTISGGAPLDDGVGGGGGVPGPCSMLGMIGVFTGPADFPRCSCCFMRSELDSPV